MSATTSPQYLYKVIPIEAWHASQGKAAIQLMANDHPFIHLATEAQLGYVLSKFFNHVPEYIVLKLDVEKLPGILKHEKNREGTNKYYHLHNGSIPMEAVVNHQAFKQDFGCDFCE